ncbi:MAG: hypothetical protein WAP51_02585 [Candidatus Sungiibacteriota bacterium]
MSYLLAKIADIFDGVKLNRVALGAIVALLLVAAVFYVYTPGTRKVAAPEYKDPCKELKNIRDKYRCYPKLALDTAQREGYNKAFALLNTIGRQNSNVQVLHVAMHVVGMMAYDQTGGDLPKIKEFISRNADPREFDFGIDGIRHGAFYGFFGAHKKEPLDKLMREACGEYYDIVDVNTEESVRKTEAEQCFHGLGHGAMIFHDNDVIKSLAECEKFSFAWMQNWCGYGVFMSNIFQYARAPYFPFTTEDAPRPHAYAGGISSLCDEVGENWYPTCARYVGRAAEFIFDPNEPEEYKRVFAECDKVRIEHREFCVRDVAMIGIPPRFQGDFQKIIAACKTAGPEYETACLESTAVWISIGGAGYSNKDDPFCALLDGGKRENCFEALREKEFWYKL